MDGRIASQKYRDTEPFQKLSWESKLFRAAHEKESFRKLRIAFPNFAVKSTQLPW
jgi:hypothetical protein